MTKCVFCGKEEAPYKGVHLISNDGSVNFFCSSKCRRNALLLKRDKKKLKWTEAYETNKEKINKKSEAAEKKEENNKGNKN